MIRQCRIIGSWSEDRFVGTSPTTGYRPLRQIWSYAMGHCGTGTNSKILGGPGQTRKIHVEESRQEVQSNPGTRPWRTYSRGASWRWPFKYVQSLWLHNCTRRKFSWVVCNISPMPDYVAYDYLCLYVQIFYNTDWCLFFSRLKNKPWLPWVYSWIRHRREHQVLTLLYYSLPLVCTMPYLTLALDSIGIGEPKDLLGASVKGKDARAC
jgi:hypothetical protein